MFKRVIGLILLLSVILGATPRVATGLSSKDVALAFVWQDTVTLADASGVPIQSIGPTFSYGQGARLFWTPDANKLYIACNDGLYVTGPEGAASVQIPGSYGRTLTFSQDGATLFYLETTAPQPLDAPSGDNTPTPAQTQGRVAYPLREMELALADGDAGRLTGYLGRFDANSSSAMIAFATMLYARDGGLLGSGRPELWPTYGSNIFATCCFPDSGLGIYDIHTGAFDVYAYDFMPGAAALNLTRTHLAGPTTAGKTIRVIDLITAGERDYTIELAGGLGTIERVAWSPDDTYLYFVARSAPQTPLSTTGQPTLPIDTNSANIDLYRLNLVTGVIRKLAWRADVYGVSSLAATDRYVFAVVVDPNTALINAWNAGEVRYDAQPTDADMAGYMPQTHLWRVSADGSESVDVLTDVWGLAARPIR